MRWRKDDSVNNVSDVMTSKKVGIYAVYDNIAKELGPIFQSINLAVAIRQFGNIIKNVPNSCDFDLWRVGFLTVSSVNEETLDQDSEGLTTKLSDIFEVVALGKEIAEAIKLIQEKQGQLTLFPGGKQNGN